MRERVAGEPVAVRGVQDPVDGAVDIAALGPVLAEAADIGFLLLGTGSAHIFPDRAMRRTFAEAGVGLEAMSTGAAARTFNVLLAEGREVAAALVAVA